MGDYEEEQRLPTVRVDWGSGDETPAQRGRGLEANQTGAEAGNTSESGIYRPDFAFATFNKKGQRVAEANPKYHEELTGNRTMVDAFSDEVRERGELEEYGEDEDEEEAESSYDPDDAPVAELAGLRMGEPGDGEFEDSVYELLEQTGGDYDRFVESFTAIQTFTGPDFPEVIRAMNTLPPALQAEFVQELGNPEHTTLSGLFLHIEDNADSYDLEHLRHMWLALPDKFREFIHGQWKRNSRS